MIQNHTQKAKVGDILRAAFLYWKKTLVFQALFSLIYFSILIIVVFVVSEKLGLLGQYQELMQKYSHDMQLYMKEAQKIAASPNYIQFFWILNGTLIFLFPLNMGLFQIYRKLDLKQPIEIADLFAGYSGSNFFKYISLALFWMMAYLLVLQTLFLPILWVFITLFTGPLMFFTNKRLVETIPLNIKALKLYSAEIFVCVVIGLFIKYLGVITIFGAIFTYPIMTAMIYALYKVIFNEVKQES